MIANIVCVEPKHIALDEHATPIAWRRLDNASGQISLGAVHRVSAERGQRPTDPVSVENARDLLHFGVSGPENEKRVHDCYLFKNMPYLSDSERDRERSASDSASDLTARSVAATQVY
jgi:hypothetical protein